MLGVRHEMVRDLYPERYTLHYYDPSLIRHMLWYVGAHLQMHWLHHDYANMGF